MDIALGEEIALVRVSPGESIHAAVLDAFEQSGRRFTTVVSMIGSLQYVDWGIASCDTAVSYTHLTLPTIYSV